MKKITKKQGRKKQTNRLFSKESINNLFLILFLFLLPTQFGKHFFLPFSYLSGVRVDYLAPTMYATDILVLILVVLNFRIILKFLKNKFVLASLVLLLVNIFFALSKEISMYRYIKILELMGVFAIFYTTKIEEKYFVYPIFAGSVFQLLLASLQLIYKKSLQGIFYFFGERYITLSMPDIAKTSLNGVEILRAYGTFSHPNSLAGFYLLLYAFFLFSKRITSNVLKGSLLLIFTLLIFFTFSKIAIATFIFINILYFLSNRKKIECLMCEFSKFFLVFILSLIFITTSHDPLSYEKRLTLMNQAVVMIQNFPWTGVGLGNFLVAQNKLVTKFLFYTFQPVHNIFLLFLTEVGIIVGLIIIYLLTLEFWRRRKNPVLLTCLLVIVITGLFDHYWLTLQQNWLLLVVVFGVGFRDSRSAS